MKCGHARRTPNSRRTWSDLAIVGGPQHAASALVTETHAAARQEGTCAPMREKPAVKPNDVGSLEGSALSSAVAGFADTMRVSAHGMATVKALKAEVEFLWEALGSSH